MTLSSSNAGAGLDAVDQLRRLIETGHAPITEAIGLISARKHRVASVKGCVPNWRFARGSSTAKVDLYVESNCHLGYVAIAVISAKEGGSNQIERHKVDFYIQDLGLESKLIRILKLFTGTIKPSIANKGEYAKDAELAKGYAHYRDLSPSNQADLIKLLRAKREAMVDRALLGRGGEIKCSDGKSRCDRVDLIAFLDRKKSGPNAWSFCDPHEIMCSILSTDVKPVERGERQVQLGNGITIKRYGGGLFKGDTRIKDHLQLQIQPRKVLDESTNWRNFEKLLEGVTIGSEENGGRAKRTAARRGLAAEKTLIARINQRDRACQWIVEECYQSHGYGNIIARKPSNREKPDVVLHEDTPDQANPKGISLKSYDPKSAFNQVNRGTIETYTRDLGIPLTVAETLRAFTNQDSDGKRVMLNEASNVHQSELLVFFIRYQRQIVSHVLRGKAKASLKADWLMFHRYPNPTEWEKHVGSKEYWSLYPMEIVIDCCCSVPPRINENGNLIIGLGLTLQRKGGDKGAKSANDLQFKMKPEEIVKALEGLC